MESSDERFRRQQQEWKHDRERREDQRRQDERERARKNAEASAQKELKRHNREIEEASRGQRSEGRPGTPRQNNSEPRYRDAPSDYQPRARRGSFLKWVVVAALLIGVVHFWPQLRALSEDASSARSTVNQSEATTPDSVTDSQPTRRADRGSAPSRPKVAIRRPITFAPKSEVVQALPEQSNDYPPCSATITDHCISK